MAQYRIRYVSHAEEQLRQLPRSLRTAFDAKIEDLKRGPTIAGDYNERTCDYSTAFGPTGIIIYAVSDMLDAVTIYRVSWLKW